MRTVLVAVRLGFHPPKIGYLPSDIAREREESDEQSAKVERERVPLNQPPKPHCNNCLPPFGAGQTYFFRIIYVSRRDNWQKRIGSGKEKLGEGHR